jgi:transposase
MFVYSEDHKAFLAAATKRVDMSQVAQQFNAHFGLNKTKRQLIACMQKYKIPLVIKVSRGNKVTLSDEQRTWIAGNLDNKSIDELRAAFKVVFDKEYSYCQFSTILKNHGFKTKGSRKGKFKFKLSDEQSNWIKEQYQTYTAAILLNMFNERYAHSLTVEQFKNVLAKHGIKSEAKFTDKVGYELNKTVFKKGGIHHTTVPVGSEAIENGYVIVKVAEPNVWRPKQRIVYEQHYGPLGKHEVVRFKDGNNRNFEPSNLFKTTRKGHGFLSKYQLLSQPKPVRESLLVLTQLHDKTDEIKLHLSEV